MKPEELIFLYFINIKSIKTDNHELASTIRILEIRVSENNINPTIMVLSEKSERFYENLALCKRFYEIFNRNQGLVDISTRIDYWQVI